MELPAAFNSFSPCLSTKDDAKRLLAKTALVQALGGEDIVNEVIGKIEDWQEVRRLERAGDPTPMCDAWLLGLAIETTWPQGQYNIYWEGSFTILEDQTLDGEGTGTIQAHIEGDCVNLLTGEIFTSDTDVQGTFTFDILGNQVTADQRTAFRLKLPAVVSVTGTDECDPFDPDGFVPRYASRHRITAVALMDMIWAPTRSTWSFQLPRVRQRCSRASSAPSPSP